MSIRLYEANAYKTKNMDGIGANSLVLDGAYFLKSTSGIIDKATTGARIVGVNQTEATFASDNQTVALKRVVFVPTEANRLYEVEISGGTITVADELKYYNLTDADTVDGTSETTTESYVDTVAGSATDPVIKMQLQLVKFVSSTKGIFKIVE